MCSEFSAVSPMIGYLYQVRYSLLEILRQEKFKYLTIEKLDDIGLEDKSNNIELLQLKHHEKGVLSDFNSDLWKTFRIWCKGIKDKSFDSSKTKFTIITTQTTGEESAVYLLTPLGRAENPKVKAQDIIDKLKDIISRSKSKTNEPCYKEFSTTSTSDLLNLINNMTIIDNAQNIQDIRDSIEHELRFICDKKHIKVLGDRLEGWWFQRVVEQLATEGLPPISSDEVRYKIDDLRGQFMVENLPIDYADEIEIDTAIYQDKVFIEQLKLIEAKGNRCMNAIYDYYRAVAQRSRWGREDLISGKEIEKYEERLEQEWERIFDAITDEIEDNNEKEKIKKGKDIYKKIEIDTKINIRKRCVEPYVMRGSYHMLADELRVGWHPDFKEIISKMLAQQKGA